MKRKRWYLERLSVIVYSCVLFLPINMIDIQSVGLREFRTNLHKYTQQTTEPLVITSHGEAIGYYIPARPSPGQQDIAALQEAAHHISAMLKASGIHEDEIVADFRQAQHDDTSSCAN